MGRTVIVSHGREIKLYRCVINCELSSTEPRVASKCYICTATLNVPGGADSHSERMNHRSQLHRTIQGCALAVGRTIWHCFRPKWSAIRNTNTHSTTMITICETNTQKKTGHPPPVIKTPLNFGTAYHQDIPWTLPIGTTDTHSPMVLMNVLVKASSEKRNKIHVFPTPESPISNNLNSRSYVFLAIAQDTREITRRCGGQFLLRNR